MELHTDTARSAARKALGYSQAFDGKGINWHSDEPWPHRMELAQALDWITDVGAIALNLADRTEKAEALLRELVEACTEVCDLTPQAYRAKVLTLGARARVLLGPNE